jgi:hypothetical protein
VAERFAHARFSRADFSGDGRPHQPVLVHLAPQRRARDAELARRVRHVALLAIEHAHDVIALDLVERPRVARALVARHGLEHRRREERLRQVDARDVVRLGDRDRALDRVLELAHVAGDSRSAGARPSRRARTRAPSCPRGARTSRGSRPRAADVLRALAQRRQLDRDDVQAIEQVLAEPSLLHQLLQRHVRRGDDARVDDVHLVVAEPSHLAALEEAQQLDLRRQRHVADLVEEQRAALGLLDQAATRLRRAREGAAHVSEQLAFDEAFGQRRAVDGHEGPVLPAALQVDGAGDEFLARAALSEDQDGALGWRDLGHQLEDALHLRCRSQDVSVRSSACLPRGVDRRHSAQPFSPSVSKVTHAGEGPQPLPP